MPSGFYSASLLFVPTENAGRVSPARDNPMQDATCAAVVSTPDTKRDENDNAVIWSLHALWPVLLLAAVR